MSLCNEKAYSASEKKENNRFSTLQHPFPWVREKLKDFPRKVKISLWSFCESKNFVRYKLGNLQESIAYLCNFFPNI